MTDLDLGNYSRWTMVVMYFTFKTAEWLGQM